MSTVIAGCQVNEKIYESDNSLIYRALRKENNQFVILKMLKQPYPPPEKIAWFKREYELTRGLDLPGVIKAYDLTTDHYHPVMVLEDFGGESFELLKKTRQFTLIELLRFFIQVVDILGQIHERHIIHKDINPSNIVLNPAVGQVKLIDFGISTILTRETPILCDPSALEGTLAYISPEQTGRMNRAVDYRTDFYSLGVTFYELLSGQLPFPIADALALVHAHIAQQPLPLHTLAADNPQPLSAIVMKLLSKNAEDRYQSAYGLKADLEECVRQWRTLGRIGPFSLSRHDVTDRFDVPQKLYGREPEINLLLASFERVSQGASELMLVSGYAGVGKSAVVQEIYKPITQRRGYFIAGKFDQLHREIPYASITQAFRSLLKQLLMESEAHVVAWREQLLAALGPNSQVIVNVIPEMELLIGPQPPMSSLPPAEAQNRLKLVFQNFIRVFATVEHPLVLFLDDLQWVDAASLNLLHHLLTAPDNRYLFIIGAYRENEVSEAHPFMLMLEEVRKGKGVVSHIVLEPLGLPDARQLIADTLRCTPERATSLAELVLMKTDGNPFFIVEFLQSLYTAELLTFDIQQHGWQWNVDHIAARDITDNVVELVASRVQTLPEQTQETLKLAACLGSQFDLRTLAIVCGKSLQETAASLQSAMAEGLILPLNPMYKLVDFDTLGLADTAVVEYKFAHDRVQQAVYSLIPHSDTQAVHRLVGRALLQQMSPEEREQKIFNIVNNLNAGRGVAQQREEQDELVTLNLLAGKKAKTAAAYTTAFHYLRCGVELSPEDLWERHYDLAVALYVEAAEAAYLSAEFEQMEQLIEVVLQRARTLLEKVQVYEIALYAYTARTRLLEGVETGLHVLELLEIKFPENPTQADITAVLEETRHTLTEKRLEELHDLPEMVEPDKLAAMRILASMMNISHFGFPRLFPLIVLRMVSLSVKYGNTPISAQAYAAYGLILCGTVGDIDAGYRFGKLALDLVERFNINKIKSSTVHIFGGFIQHWKEHVGATLKPLLQGYQVALETGDLNFAALSTFGYIFKAYWIGKELTELEREIAKFNDVIGRFKQNFILDLNKLYRQIVLNLLGRSEDPCRLIGESYDEEEMLPRWLETNHRNAICHIYLNKLILCYLFHAYPQAVEHAVRAEKYLDSLAGTAAIPPFHMYDSLAKLAIWSDVQESERSYFLKKIVINQEKMELWARHAPMNALHKFYLVEAERARVLGNDNIAREYYDQAVDLAGEHGYVNEEALANELAAKFYLARGKERIAHHYLRDAHYAYLRWGALAKVKDLEARYPQFLAQTGPDFLRATASAVTANTGQRLSRAFDFASVLKASQAISGEIRLDALLTTLMKLVIENAGAQKGFLILEEEGNLMIEAEGAIDKDEVIVLRSIPVETRPDLPATIVRYVERTKEKVVLSDATQKGAFVTDPYIVREQPKSLLCVPFVNQGKLTGILYLENNLATGAFTPDRVEVLNLLSTEAAISIENARLYRSLEEANGRLADYSKTLEQKVEDRTQALQEKNRELEVASQQVQEASRRKSQFLAGMSHQLRTPMNAILGFTRLVLRRSGELLPERQRDNLVKVRESADHLLILINQLLDLSKIEAGRMEVQPTLFNVKRFIQACSETVSPLVKLGVQLRYEISDEVKEAFADEEGLRQIVLNLLSNAIKFTEFGEVVVRVYTENQTTSEERLVILVVDTGVGIPLDKLDTIFDEFQQVGTQTREGTGLGLPIAKRWADLLGGTITVKSELNKGSTFTVMIPVIYRRQLDRAPESADL